MLTPREQEINSLKSQGMSIPAIARDLCISESTVRSHLSRIKKKMDSMVFEAENSDCEDAACDCGAYAEDEGAELFGKYQADYWKKKYSELKSVHSFEKQVISLIKDSIVAKKPIDYIVPCKAPNNNTTEELVLLLSDFHAGEEVDCTEMLGINEYNMDVMIRRIQKMFRSIESIVGKMSGYNYDKLNIFLLGDMVSGIIHEELLQGTTTVDQIIITSEILAEFFVKLSSLFKEIEITGIVGNHGRFNKKPNYKKKYNNFDYLFYKMIEARCANCDRIRFNIPKSSIAMKQIFDWNFVLIHGDGINGFSGIPFYGIRRIDAQLSQLLVTTQQKYPHFVCMGHFHQINHIEKIGGRIIMNGSLKGADEFALGKMFTGGEPKQVLFSVHPKHGLTWEMSLNLP